MLDPHLDKVDQDCPFYDKLNKVRWFLDCIRDRCKNMWALNQQLTIVESMIRYKEKYCLVRQHMPNKPVRFGIKAWALADSISKYIWNFYNYYSKTGNPHNGELDIGIGDEVEPQEEGIGSGKELGF